MEGRVHLQSFAALALNFIVSFVYSVNYTIRFLADVIWKGPWRMFHYRTRNVRPEILKNNEFGTHTFVRLPKSRVTLHCVVNGPTDKPLMLFIHGFPECWLCWRHQLKEFSEDYRVVAFDMRGYGESSKPAYISDYILDTLCDDVDQLITELGYEKAIIVSHDWGSLVAFGFAAVYPQRVERLVISNVPHPKAFEKFVQKSVPQLLKSWYVFVWQCPILPVLIIRADDMSFFDEIFTGTKLGLGAKPGTFTPEIIEAYKYTFATYHDLAAPINYYRAFLRYASPAVESAFNRSKITVPTLIIWGTKDGALETKLAELSTQRVEQCTLEYIEGASHWVQQEEPEKYNQVLRQFLRKSF